MASISFVGTLLQQPGSFLVNARKASGKHSSRRGSVSFSLRHQVLCTRLTQSNQGYSGGLSGGAKARYHEENLPNHGQEIGQHQETSRPIKHVGRVGSLSGDAFHRSSPFNSSSDQELSRGVNYDVHVVKPAWMSALRHVATACLAAYLFGYHMGVVNGPLEYLAADLGFAASSLKKGLVVSIFLVGAFLGCAVSSSIADGIGRRKSFQAAAIPIFIGTLLSSTAQGFNQMIAGRFLTGSGLGVGAAVCALYISEISPIQQRGTFGSLVQVATCVGILSALAASFPLATNPGWWRTCFWFGTAPAVMLLGGMQFCAESPRWLAEKQRWGDTETAMESLWGRAEVKGAMFDLQRNSGGEVVGLGAAVFGLQQLAGINAIFYFSSTIFKNAGIQSDIIASTVMGTVNLLAALVSTLLMDRLGRKKLLSWSFAGMGAAMATQAVFLGLPALQSFAPTASVLGTLLYVIAFALGAGPVPALLLPEMFPDRIRAKGMAVSMCVHWVFNFVIGLTFLPLLQLWGPSTLYSCFAVLCCVAVVFTSRCIIETKGRSLEEIEKLLLPPVH
eukprot:jgi/Mesen1/4616/ME000236S03868